MPKINDEYDIGAAFQAIENELISSMIRNMKRHKVEEADENKQWSMWQAEQLKSLEKYRKENQEKYGKQFQSINNQIEGLIRSARDEGDMQQEIAILEAIKKGFPASRTAVGASAEFFHLNERKLEALIKATTDDMEKAETAVLRMANDQYRKVIYNAQVYANSGAGTYEKAVDMATKDFISSGLNCVEYKNGARHTLSDYADMAIRTACKRAYLQGEGQKRQEWGIDTVIVNKRGNPCPLCLPFVGKVLIDDVWSGGKAENAKFPLMSYAISKGLYHPRCRDSHTTYFPGISTVDDNWTEEELKTISQESKEEAQKQYAERQEKRFERLAKFSLDLENRKQYVARREEWKSNISEDIQNTNSIEQLEEVMKNYTNKEISLTGTALDLMKRNMNQLLELCNEYGIHFSEIKTTAGRKYLGDVERAGRYGEKVSILYPKKFYSSRKALLDELRKSAESGNMPRIGGRNVDVYTTVHEFAHTLSERITSSLYGGNEDFWDEIENVYFDYKKRGNGILGKYASENQNEFLAEAFAEAKLGARPSEYAENVLSIVDKYFKKSIAKEHGSGIIKENGDTLKMNLQFFAESDIKNQESGSLKRAIRKYEKRIKEHESYLENPEIHCSDWNEKNKWEQEGLKKHWNKEIRNFNQSIQDRIDELKARGDYDG